MTSLSRIRAVLPQVTFHQFADVDVRGVAYDSRRAEPGHVFFAVPGTVQNGLDFVGEAIRRGAIAIIAEFDPREAVGGERAGGRSEGPVARADHATDGHATKADRATEGGRAAARRRFVDEIAKRAGPGIPIGLVPDVRRALARVAHLLHGRPADCLHNVGVTGTNGKTTTAKMIQSILAAAEWTPAYFGTVGYEFGSRILPAPRTTPASADLARMLRDAVDAGHRASVIEVSSHALAQHRTAEVPFRVAVFTNLTRDHQDYHGSMERYYLAKRRLFDQLAEGGVAAIDIGSPYGVRLADHCRRRGIDVVTCGTSKADVWAGVTETRLRGSSFTLHTPLGTGVVDCPLPGTFNVTNAVTAAAAAVAFGVSLHAITSGLSALATVPGRMECLDPGPRPLRQADDGAAPTGLGAESGPTVIVDYAHSHAALATVLDAVCQLRARGAAGGARARVHVVFGCGGGKDPGRRPRMGRVAATFADRMIVTSDNPRREDPHGIIEQILTGVSEANGRASAEVDVEVEVDRGLAIRRAIHAADPADVVVIAGKGHEPFQELGDVTIPFDDRAEARAALRERRQGIAGGGRERAAEMARLFGPGGDRKKPNPGAIGATG